MEAWAVRDAAEWEQNQAERSSENWSGLRESFARPETAHSPFAFLSTQPADGDAPYRRHIVKLPALHLFPFTIAYHG
jgi:hypothetical protein